MQPETNIPEQNKSLSKDKKYHKIIAISVIVILALLITTIFRIHATLSLRKEAKSNAYILVSVITPKMQTGEEELILPGTVDAWHDAVIYARTNGYVKHWFTPIGTYVHKGDILAEIETPEVDAQLRQAESEVLTAQANYQLAKITAERWKTLVKSGSVSKQDADEKISDAKAKEATLMSAKSNRDHLYELTIFKIVRAPFDGVIYARLVDAGTLVNAGNNPQQPMFNIAQVDKLRIYVNVPQLNSARIVDGISADVYFAEHPSEVYKANLNHIAKNLDQTTRTLLTEFKLNNSDRKLYAGGYAEVHIKLPAANYLYLPVNALIFRAAGLQVATVVKENTSLQHSPCSSNISKQQTECPEQLWKVVLKNIVIRRDFGDTVEVASGLSPNDLVIINPPDSLRNEQQVYIKNQT